MGSKLFRQGPVTVMNRSTHWLCMPHSSDVTAALSWLTAAVTAVSFFCMLDVVLEAFTLKVYLKEALSLQKVL